MRASTAASGVSRVIRCIVCASIDLPPLANAASLMYGRRAFGKVLARKK